MNNIDNIDNSNTNNTNNNNNNKNFPGQIKTGFGSRCEKIYKLKCSKICLGKNDCKEICFKKTFLKCTNLGRK